MRRRKLLVILALALVGIAVVIGLTRRVGTTFSAMVAHYDSTDPFAFIVITNNGSSALEYTYQTGGREERYGHLESHEALQIGVLLLGTSREIYIESAPTGSPSLFDRLAALLERLGVRVASKASVTLNLTNSSGWHSSGR